MKEETEERRILNSLNSLQYLCGNISSIGSGKNFIEIYDDCLERIRKRSESTSSEYMKEKLNEFPTFSVQEIDVYIEGEKDGMITRLSPIAGIFKGIWNTVKSKGTNLSNTTDKFRVTSSICNNVIQVIEKPGLEEMINQSKK